MALILPSSAGHLCVLPNIFLRVYAARSQPDFSAIFSRGDASAVISAVRNNVHTQESFGVKPWMWGSRAPTVYTYIFGGLEGYHYIRRWPVTFRCSTHTHSALIRLTIGCLACLSQGPDTHTRLLFPSMFGDVSELWLVVAGWRTVGWLHFS